MGAMRSPARSPDSSWRRAGCGRAGAAGTWSRRIWQTSGVKWRRAARVLLRILRSPYWTVRKARCSEASASALGCLVEGQEGGAGAAVGSR